MPRIDPIQLLNCLSVLLSPNGGIKSKDEVQRLARLMTKFSKKLVSKCIYIQVLKCTDTDLLSLFMGSGGWRLVHTWLTESIIVKNWPLVKELLELLLLSPVDIERLKTNNCPKLVKELSKDGNQFAIRALASKLVEQWLKTVKGEHTVPIKVTDIPQIISDAQLENSTDNLVQNELCSDSENVDKTVNESESNIKEVEHTVNTENSSELLIKDNENIVSETTKADSEKEPETLPVLKITLKDGKQTVSQLDENEDKPTERSLDKEKSKEKHKSKTRDKSHDKSSSSSSSKSKHLSKSHSSNDKHKSSNHKSSKDKSKEKDKHSSHSSKSKSDTSKLKSNDKSKLSSKTKDERSSKSDKDKSKGKEDDKNDKDNAHKSDSKSEDKTQTPTIQKLAKIPKLSDVKKEKPSISIEVRKPDEPKPKTVKTFNSKFRKHGLEEEIKPPPSRASVLNKKSPVLPPTVPTLPLPKRPSPVHNESPPVKKPKTVESVEKPGAIKLIPPKPKPMMLLESDMFMDALNASATNKKEPKKRKRRTSGSKDGNTPGDGSPPHTPTTVSSPSTENKSVPPRFYQDTLDTEEDKEKTIIKSPSESENIEMNDVTEKDKEEIIEPSEPHTLTINGLKGVLCYHKRKGPKKSIKWKPDSELEEIQYFELDETERVNVTKTFTDMKHLERINEREAFQKARNLSNDDVMEEKISWRSLIVIDTDGQVVVEHGKSSKEKEIQAIRQKGTLQPLYFHKSMIPDSPLEPDVETQPYNLTTEPTIIPLDDVTGNQDNISDFRNMPWPEPKGNAPPTTNNVNIPTIFPANMSQFPPNFPSTQFPGVPSFQGPNMGPNEWQNAVPPHMMPNGMPGPMAPVALNPAGMPPGNMPPGMMIPPENMMMGPEMFGAPNPIFTVPPEGFNMQQNMFPPDFGMPGPEGFPGPGNFRGAMRGRGSGGHWRGKGTGNWDGPPRGRGSHSRGGRKAVCIYFQRKGSCRQGDNCSFLHPGVNCPY